MQVIKGILFEPVGCLAEFPAEPFLEIAAQLSGKKKQLSKSGSRAYWHLLNLMENMPGQMDALEIEAVEYASLYEDVIPALAELKAMDIQLIIASSLSGAAIARFIEKNGLHGYFSSLWTRDRAKGIKVAPLRCALKEAGLQPGHAIFLTDTAEGLKAAENAAVNAVLMMNDPDESRRLATHNPAGGIVSLHELPDFIQIVRAQSNRDVS
jgi:beta-phosphoglucomutase-like phosphatase (HAD superfamily)